MTNSRTSVRRLAIGEGCGTRPGLRGGGWLSGIKTCSSLLGATALFALAACGGNADSDSVVPPAAEPTAPVLLPESMFTVDDLVAAGWKKSKQIDATSLPPAIAVWYGFYDQRDIEVRIYGSHDDAKGPGAQSADAAVTRSPNSNIGGGIITSAGNRVQYHAYTVVGNLVVLCQQDVDVCLRLTRGLPEK